LGYSFRSTTVVTRDDCHEGQQPPSGPVTITVWAAADPSGMTCPYAAEVISGF